MWIPFISNWIIKKRISLALWFGNIEHVAGRIIGLLIVLSASVPGYIWYTTQAKYALYTLYMLGLTFICWLIYLIAHTLEKKCYGHFGPRG